MDNKKVYKNAGWIIACKIVQSLLGLVVSMFTARYLGPSNYGLINYAASVVSFVIPIMQLGLNNIMVMEIVSNKDKEGEILGTSITLCSISSLFTIIGVLCFVMTANAGELDTFIVTLLYSTMLIAQALEMVQYWFQAKLLSKYTSIIALISYCVISAFRVILLIVRCNVYWFAVASSLDAFIIAFCLIALYKKKSEQKLSFSKKTAKLLLQKGKYYIVSSMMVAIFAQTDKIMLKLMIDETATGIYSAAIVCASISSFVFAAIIDSMRPLIFENKATANKDYEKNISRLYSIIIYLSLVQSLVMTFCGGLIIKILYGDAYVESANVLRLVVWYTTFSYMGSVRNVWILAEGKQNLLWIINLCGALTNVILNFVLIPYWGVMGAAFASLITQFFTNFVLGFIMKPIRPNNRLVLKSLNPKLLKDMIRKIFKRNNDETGKE